VSTRIRKTPRVGVGDGKADVRGRIARVQTDGVFELACGVRPSVFQVERVAEPRVRGPVVRPRRDRVPGERFRKRRLLQLHGELGERNPPIGLIVVRRAQRPQHADGLGAIARRAERAHEIVAGSIDAHAGVERVPEVRDRVARTLGIQIRFAERVVGNRLARIQPERRLEVRDRGVGLIVRQQPLSHSKVHDAGIRIDLRGARHASHLLSLTGNLQTDREIVADALVKLRDVIPDLPEDPHLLLPDKVVSSRSERSDAMPGGMSLLN